VPEPIQAVADFLQSQPRDRLVTLAQIYDALPENQHIEIGEALDLLKAHRLVRATFEGEFQLTPSGLTAFNDNCLRELVGGMEYVAQRLRDCHCSHHRRRS